jgi:uncharacterized membrane protein
MAAILTSLRNTVLAGFALAIVVLVIVGLVSGGYNLTFGKGFWLFVVRWLHVISGVMWIGLLYYFNFVQIPNMPKIPDEQKPAIGKVIAPAALFWFRWAAMATIVFGVILALLNNYFVEVLSLGATNGFAVPGHTALGIGIWFGIIMWANVWFVIWPNQKKALNIGNKYPDLAADAKAKAAKTAMLFSRTNTVLSLPMLFCMVAAQGLFRLS